MGPVVKIEWLDEADRSLGFPAYQTPGAAGADIRANLPAAQRDEGITIAPGARALVATGLRMEIPAGFEAQVRPRSGLALKQGLIVPNSPGTIDSDYRGPVGVILLNAGTASVHIAHGDRIAQIVVAPVVQAAFEEVQTVSATARGAGGFGSTGERG